MANKRQRKKQNKQKQINVLKQVGYKPKDIKKLTVSERTQTVKKAERNIKQNERRLKNLEKWENLGIDKSIISRYDLRNKNPDNVSSAVFTEIKKQSTKAKAKATRERNKTARYNKLIKAGYEPHEIKKGWLTSDKHTYSALNRIIPYKLYNTDLYLGIAFAPVNADSSFYTTAMYKDWDYEQILEEIQYVYNSAVNNPDESGRLACIFKIVHGSKSFVDAELKEYEQRGYNLKVGKLIDNRYYRLFNRNDWTMREFAEMVLCIISQSLNRYVPTYWTQLLYYINESGLPFAEVFTGI